MVHELSESKGKRFLLFIIVQGKRQFKQLFDVEVNLLTPKLSFMWLGNLRVWFSCESSGDNTCVIDRPLSLLSNQQGKKGCPSQFRPLAVSYQTILFSLNFNL